MELLIVVFVFLILPGSAMAYLTVSMWINRLKRFNGSIGTIMEAEFNRITLGQRKYVVDKYMLILLEAADHSIFDDYRKYVRISMKIRSRYWKIAKKSARGARMIPATPVHTIYLFRYNDDVYMIADSLTSGSYKKVVLSKGGKKCGRVRRVQEQTGIFQPFSVGTF